jgi:hypothetical protein
MNPLPSMTYDFFMGQLRLIAVGVIAYLAGSGRLTSADASAATAVLVPIGLLMGPWLWSLYVNVGKKLVPSNSVAISSDAVSEGAPIPGHHVVIQGVQSDNEPRTIVKVVGALLFAIILPLMISPTFAADKALPSDPFSVLRTFTVNDLQAALDDANAQVPPDTIAATCYAALIPLVSAAQSPLPGKLGVFLALQKTRDVVNKVSQVQANIGPIADAKNKCAAVVLDTQNFLLRLGVIGAGAIIKPF